LDYLNNFQVDLKLSQHILWFIVYIINQYDAQQIKDLKLLRVHGLFIANLWS